MSSSSFGDVKIPGCCFEESQHPARKCDAAGAVLQAASEDDGQAAAATAAIDRKDVVLMLESESKNDTSRCSLR